MNIPIEAYQFLSRRIDLSQDLKNRKSWPKQRPDIVFSLDGAIVPKPFEINFAHLKPCGPSIGAFEYIDDPLDFYLTQRWPYCIALKGSVNFPEENLTLDLIKNLLGYMKLLLWTPGDSRFQGLLEDQRATTVGYRWIYLTHQIGDISGNRRPSSLERYFKTAVGDPVGPGVSCLPNGCQFEFPNEYVWSQILSFPGATNQQNDIDEIRQKIQSLKKHSNGYNELRDAKRHLKNNEVRAVVRSAAPAIDAILHYYCEIWNVKFPNEKEMPFDQKIETVLRLANKPSYRQADPCTLQTILFLYRSRNSMHEGDCFYKDATGKRVDVNTIAQASEFVEAVERFVIWIDSHA